MTNIFEMLPFILSYAGLIGKYVIGIMAILCMMKYLRDRSE
jgi:hypothetical protein